MRHRAAGYTRPCMSTGAAPASGIATYRILRELGSRSQRSYAAIREPHDLVVIHRFGRHPGDGGPPVAEGVAALSPEQLGLLLRDAQCLATNWHPNIARIKHVDLVSGDLTIATELVDGATLGDLIAICASRDAPFPRDVLVRVLIDVLAGAHGIHAVRDANQPLPPRHGTGRRRLRGARARRGRGEGARPRGRSLRASRDGRRRGAGAAPGEARLRRSHGDARRSRDGAQGVRRRSSARWLGGAGPRPAGDDRGRRRDARARADRADDRGPSRERREVAIDAAADTVASAPAIEPEPPVEMRSDDAREMLRPLHGAF